MWIYNNNMPDSISDQPVYAHIYNRGVDRRIIFKSDEDRNRFMLTMRMVLLKNTDKVSLILHKRRKKIITSIKQRNLASEFGPSIVEILAFCLMPNHYHILLRASKQEDITKFAQRLANSYTRYFNTKYKRKGRLFESSYKIVLVHTDEQLIHLTRYIHTNPANSKKLSLSSMQLRKYQWSSLPAYLKGDSKMCDIQFVLALFQDIPDFWEFTKAGIHIDEELDEKLLLDKNT